MKKRFIIILLAVALPLMCSCNRNAAETKESFDGVYELLEMIQSNNEGAVFSVRECDAQYDEVLLFTPRYSYVHGVEAYWARNNYDFFVLSHDTGCHPYIFNNNTWESGYIISITESEQGEYSAKLTRVADDTSFEYDFDNIPEEIIDYLKKLP
ncbi:MAG: hypothetical protein J5756_06235 [Clostridia bacterium]|nr:hypothetical protein [Clostridia bacterium]